MKKAALEIRSLWADVLGLEQVGDHDNFFALGGDSMSAIILLNKLRSLSGLRMEPVDLFDNSSFAEFAALVEKKLQSQTDHAERPAAK